MAERDRYEDLLGELPNVEAAQVRRCARALLLHPMLHASGPDAELLPHVFRHREVLRRLFGRYLGYPLRVERRFARLYKSLDGGVGRGVAGFTPRGYAYLALTLAALVESGGQILLSQLIGGIRGAAAEAGIALGEGLVDLRALAAALRHLVALGVLEETEGTVGAVAHGRSDEALITVDSELLGLLVPPPRVTDSSHAGATGRQPVTVGLPVGMVARRRLTEDPVVLYADLPCEDADYLRDHHRQVSYWLDRYFGLQVEVRAEGMLAIDPDHALTDVPFPASSTVSRMALLTLRPLLAESSPNEQTGCHAVELSQIRSVCVDLIGRYPSGWAKGELASLDALTSRVIEVLVQTGIARRVPDDVVLLVPAAHRWQPLVEEKSFVEPVFAERDTDEPTLFGDMEEAW